MAEIAGSPRPLVPSGENGNQRSHSAAGPVRPRASTIDVGKQVAEIEHVLRAGGDLRKRVAALAILERWQFDEMLDDASRKRAQVLVREFGDDGSADVVSGRAVCRPR